jgi:hypothetical protein
MNNIKIEDVIKNPENYYYMDGYLGEGCEILYCVLDEVNFEVVVVYRMVDGGITSDDVAKLENFSIKATDDIGYMYEKKKWVCTDSSYDVLNVYYDQHEQKMFVVFRDNNFLEKGPIGSWGYDFKTFLDYYTEVK